MDGRYVYTTKFYLSLLKSNSYNNNHVEQLSYKLGSTGARSLLKLELSVLNKIRRRGRRARHDIERGRQGEVMWEKSIKENL